MTVFGPLPKLFVFLQPDTSVLRTLHEKHIGVLAELRQHLLECPGRASNLIKKEN